MRRVKLRTLAAVLAAIPLVAGCAVDDDIPTTPPVGGALFSRYVALGNSITAGYQSGGLNGALQVRAYPYLLAAKAGARFDVPLVATPGCPRPFLAPLRPDSLAGTVNTCFLVNSPRIAQNVAVPGEAIADLVTAPTTGQLGALHNLLIGPRTQVQAMLDANPSLVSVWIGNNDALGVVGGRGTVLPGDTAALTSTAVFQQNLSAIVGEIEKTPAAQNDAVILIGVVDVGIVPLIQPGAFFFLARDAAGRFNGKPVNANCSPVNALGQPNPLSANLVNFQIVRSAVPEISCANDAPLVINATERLAITNRVNAFNAAIKAAADANGYIYVDPNAILAPFVTETTAAGRYNFIRKCQGLATATTPAAFQAAVLNSCPVPGPTAAPNQFGSLFSFDAVHPSSLAHEIIADALAAQINARFGTELPTD